MSLVDLASANSFWRGIDYYDSKRVISARKISEIEYEGLISGSEKDPYKVRINLEHPRSSTCTCPFASGHRVVCKHMVALYFNFYPEEAEECIRAAEEFEAEREKHEHQKYLRVKQYVDSLSPEELKSQLLYALLEKEDEYDRMFGYYDEDDYWR